jgi:hypothetical protein
MEAPPMTARVTWRPMWRVRYMPPISPRKPSHNKSGKSAKIERQNTIWPVG